MFTFPFGSGPFSAWVNRDAATLLDTPYTASWPGPRRLEVNPNAATLRGTPTGSNLSAILFGDLREVIVGMFGDLEIVVDPHSKLSENLLRIAWFMEIDLGLRHVESFASMNDAITT